MDDLPAMDGPPAWDLFPDGGFVRLRRFGQDTYVHADEDAVGVSLRRLGPAPSLNAVWRAEHLHVNGASAPFLLLQGAAYGRYLAVSNVRARHPSRSVRTVQRDYDSPGIHRAFMWRPYRTPDGSKFVYLVGWGNCLCGSGGGWTASMFGEHDPVVTAWSGWDVTLFWRVEAIQPSRVPLPLPPHPAPEVFNISDIILGCPQPKRLGRRIRHVRADDDGRIHLDLVDWPDFFFNGRSLANLRDEMWLRQGVFNVPGITLCVRAGSNALPIPLVIDLPENTDPMDIIVYNSGSPAAKELVYPQYHVQEQ